MGELKRQNREEREEWEKKMERGGTQLRVIWCVMRGSNTEKMAPIPSEKERGEAGQEIQRPKGVKVFIVLCGN